MTSPPACCCDVEPVFGKTRIRSSRISDGETMNARKALHDLVDRLPESELVTAARILRALDKPGDVEELLENAPRDDEPFDARDLEDTEGPYLPHTDVVHDRQDE